MTTIVMNYFGTDDTYINPGKHVALGFTHGGDVDTLFVILKDKSGMPRAFEVTSAEWRIYDVSVPAEQFILKTVEGV